MRLRAEKDAVRASTAAPVASPMSSAEAEAAAAAAAAAEAEAEAEAAEAEAEAEAAAEAAAADEASGCFLDSLRHHHQCKVWTLRSSWARDR